MIPSSFFNGGALPEFLASLRSADAKLLKLCEQARGEGKVLRFVADITDRGCEVGLKKVSKDSPVGRLAGPDNILVFQTQRYFEHPLVIQGPGAGASVTSAGVLSDILKIAKSI
jgi:aspartokinase/homoserine dehydrogenase 1